MERAYRATLLVGIAALPLAMVARRAAGDPNDSFFT
jgi:hypothetical protein